MFLYITNAKIATMDDEHPYAAAAIAVGKYFAYVGDDEGARAYMAAHEGEYETVDCGGGFVMPGFNDSHMHYLHYVKANMSSVDLRGCTRLSEVTERMAEYYRSGYDKAGGLWLVGEGWNHDYFTDEKRFPTAKDLDEITTEYPMLIMRACFHVGVLNTKAMELIGLDAAAAKALGGYAELDESGNPNGVIKESYFDSVKGNIPAPTPEQLVDMMGGMQHKMFEVGITSVQSDDLGYMPTGTEYKMLALLRRAGENGSLKLRIAQQALLPQWQDLTAFLYDNGIDATYGNATFKISCVKLLADGSLGARTALMRKPYNDAANTLGLAIYDQATLNKLVLEAHKNNIPAAIHAIGDGAVEMCLNAIENAQNTYPHIKLRHGIVHCQITDMAQLERFKELDVTAYVQPVFIDYDMHIVEDRVGKELASTSYAWNTMLSLGIHAPYGTDCPVESCDPLRGIYCAVTRRDTQGRGPYLPQQAVTRAKALYAYTAEGAYASYDENIKGKIKPGFLADFVLLDTDLIDCKDEEILTAKVKATYVGGEKVFERN